jgi:hypothetical protein
VFLVSLRPSAVFFISCIIFPSAHLAIVSFAGQQLNSSDRHRTSASYGRSSTAARGERLGSCQALTRRPKSPAWKVFLVWMTKRSLRVHLGQGLVSKRASGFFSHLYICACVRCVRAERREVEAPIAGEGDDGRSVLEGAYGPRSLAVLESAEPEQTKASHPI